MPRCLIRRLVSTWIACSVFGLASAAPEITAPPPSLSLEQAIGQVQQQGLPVVYSTDLVKPWMRIAANPMAGDLVRQLDEILAPFGLCARRHASGTYIVTRSLASTTSTHRDGSGQQGRGSIVGPTALAEIEVVARPYQLTRALDGAGITLLASEIEKIPQFGDDALRAVSRLPGTAAGGFSAQSHIRGGDVDEVSVRFDGMQLHNPYHLKDYQSVFSAIDARLVSTANVYTGGLPAQFGGRMSGLIDIAPFAPESGRYRELAVSLFNTSVLASGDLRSRNATWMVSARRTNVDLWYPSVNNQGGLPVYGDGFARLAFDLTKSLRLALNTFYFTDDLTLQAENGDEQTETVYIDRYYWLRLDHSHGEALRGVTLLSDARLASHRFGIVDQPGVSRGSVADQREFRFDAIQTDWTWRAAENWLLQFGAHAQRSRGKYDYASNATLELRFRLAPTNMDQLPASLSFNRALVTQAAGDRAGLYASARVEMSPRLAADLGLRADNQRLASASYFGLSPRLGMRYRLSATDDLRASWGRSIQAQDADEVLIEDGAPHYYRPQATDQLTLGYEHRRDNGVEMRVDVYDKKIRDPRPRFENLLNTLTLAPELKPDRILIAPLSASARGVELSMRQAAPQRPSWWASYTFARATDQFTGYQVPRSWDQRHTFSAGLSIDGHKWTFGASLLARSGWPITRVSADLSGLVPQVNGGARNADNLSTYASLDLRIARRFDLQQGSLSAFFELTNALGRNNPCCTAYDLADDNRGLDFETKPFLPIFPSLGFIWKLQRD